MKIKTQTEQYWRLLSEALAASGLEHPHSQAAFDIYKIGCLQHRANEVEDIQIQLQAGALSETKAHHLITAMLSQKVSAELKKLG